MKAFIIFLTAAVFFVTDARAEPGFIGLQVQGMSPAMSTALGRKKPDGVLVRDVELSSPADKAGLERGDLIVSFNSQPVETFDGLVALAGKVEAGQAVPVGVIRPGGDPVKLTLTAGPWPNGRKISRNSFAVLPEVGLTLTALTEKVRERFGLRWGTTGVVVSLVDNEKGQYLDLLRGEMILQVNQKKVWEPQQVLDAYNKARDAGRVAVLLLVEGANGFRFSLLPVHKVEK